MSLERQLLYAISQYDILVTVNSSIDVPAALEKNLLQQHKNQQQILVVCHDAKQQAAQATPSGNGVVGHHVGYSIPFEDQTSSITRIKYVSAEMMIWEALRDPALSTYTLVVVKDVHKRELWIDVAVALLKKIKAARDRTQASVKLVFDTTGWTTKLVRDYFSTSNVGIVNLEGDSPAEIDVQYVAQPVNNYVRAIADTVIDINKREGPGDILALATSSKEVDEIIRHLQLEPNLNIATQSADFSPVKRNVLVTTSIQQCDLLVDSGFERVGWSVRGASTHKTAPISKSEAQFRRQFVRKKCFCLYTVQGAAEMDDHNKPHIHGAADLTQMVIQLKALGITNLLEFDYLTKPSEEALAKAFNKLKILKAVDAQGALTRQGTIMASLPLPTAMAMAISEGAKQGCFYEVLAIVSCSYVGGLDHLFKRGLHDAHDKFKVQEGDHVTMLNVFKAFDSSNSAARDYQLQHFYLSKAANIYHQLETYCTRLGIKPAVPSQSSDVMTRKIVSVMAKAYGYQLAKRTRHGYELVGHNRGQMAQLHSSCVLKSFDQTSDAFRYLSPWVVYEELIDNDDDLLVIKSVSVVDRSMLDPELYTVR